MKKISVYIAIFFLLIAFVMLALLQISKSRHFQFFGEIIPSVKTDKKFVALTFDDGPTKENTEEILQILEQEDVKATFFLIGSDMNKNEGETEKIIAKGHEIGNHSYSHKRMMFVSPTFVKEEIEKTDKLIRKAGYKDEILFRPPYGKKLFLLPWYLAQNNRKSITWDIEPETWEMPPRPIQIKSDEVIQQTVEQIENGSIILLHVMYKRNKASMKAVRPIIKGLRDKQFEFVTVSELLKKQQ